MSQHNVNSFAIYIMPQEKSSTVKSFGPATSYPVKAESWHTKTTRMVNTATVLLDACTLLGTTKLNIYSTSITCWPDLKPTIMHECVF
jgi:hypothetical protein